MNDQEQQILLSLLQIGKEIIWVSPADHHCEKVIKIKYHDDEPSLVAMFPDGRYAALYNCELSDFKITEDIMSNTAGKIIKHLAAMGCTLSP